MTTLPTLYRRTAKKKIERWTISFHDNYFYTTSGEVGGKITESKPNHCVAKNVGRANATTCETQAEAEARAKWAKRVKTGYFEDIGRVDDFYFVEPMLATPLHKVKGGLHFPCLLQLKFNGVRAIATKDGLFSREGELWETVPHIDAALKPFFELHPNAVLDGELFSFNHRAALNEMIKLVRKDPENMAPADWEKSREMVCFHPYDGYSIHDDTQQTSYTIRKERMDRALYESGAFSGGVVPVMTAKCLTQEDVDTLYGKALEDNHEGCIIRYETNRYENGIRSKHLVKLKPESSNEAFITAIEEGAGNWAGTGKAIWLDWNGVKFKASFKGTLQDATEFWQNREEWIGREVTFCYLALTGKGIPFSGRVDYKNCLKK